MGGSARAPRRSRADASPPVRRGRAGSARRSAARQSSRSSRSGSASVCGRAVAEVAREVEAAALGDRAGWPARPPAGRRTAPPSRPAASARARGCRGAAASHASRVAWVRMATSASCSGPRRRACTCTSLVATSGSSRRRASSTQRAHPRPVAALEAGACSSTHSRSPKACRSTSARASASARSPRTSGAASAPCAAQPRQADQPAGPLEHGVERRRRLGHDGAAVGRPGARVRAGQQLAEVAVARRGPRPAA